jgi:hypothetical protein
MDYLTHRTNKLHDLAFPTTHNTLHNDAFKQGNADHRATTRVGATTKMEGIHDVVSWHHHIVRRER